MSLPEGFHARRASRGDLQDWLRICAEVDVAETGEVDYDEGVVLEEWDRPRFDLERDAWVLTDTRGAVVGHCHAWEVAPAARVVVDTYVSPRVSEQLEEPLLDLAIADGLRIIDASGGHDVAFQVPNAESNTRRAGVIASRGFAPVRHFLRMRLDLSAPPRKAPAPTEATLRAYDPERDEKEFHAAQSSAFAEHWGDTDHSYGEWRASFVDTPTYDPSLWSVAEVDGAIAGVLVARADVEGKGWVRTLAVLPEHRGRGLGEALLLRAFDQFRERGWTVADLAVDAENRTGAARLYERVGMHVAFATGFWERRVSARQ